MVERKKKIKNNSNFFIFIRFDYFIFTYLKIKQSDESHNHYPNKLKKIKQKWR